MKVLSIDTSSSACVVSLLEDFNIIKELTIENEKTHSEKLFPLIQEILSSTSTDISEIKLLVCSIGPRFLYRN